MKKLRDSFILILFFFIFFSKGQISTKKSKKVIYGFPLDVSYGAVVHEGNLLNQINRTDSLNWQLPVRTVGVGLSEFNVTVNRYSYSNYQNYSHYIPSRIRLNDSTTGQLSGFAYNFQIGTRLFKKSKWLFLSTGIGFATGRSIIRSQTANSYKNPYFAPQAFLRMSFNVKRICIIFLSAYRYDVSSKNWRQRKDNGVSIALGKFDQGGYILQASLGYFLTKYETRDKSKSKPRDKKKD